MCSVIYDQVWFFSPSWPSAYPFGWKIPIGLRCHVIRFPSPNMGLAINSTSPFFIQNCCTLLHNYAVLREFPGCPIQISDIQFWHIHTQSYCRNQSSISISTHACRLLQFTRSAYWIIQSSFCTIFRIAVVCSCFGVGVHNLLFEVTWYTFGWAIMSRASFWFLIPLACLVGAAGEDRLHLRSDHQLAVQCLGGVGGWCWVMPFFVIACGGCWYNETDWSSKILVDDPTAMVNDSFSCCILIERWLIIQWYNTTCGQR